MDAFANVLVMVVMLVDAMSGRKLSYGEIADRSKELGVGLKTLWGWKKGDVMSVFTYVHVDSIAFVFTLCLPRLSS